MLLENTLVNYYFEKICSIPHVSFHEKEISDYIVSEAKRNGYEFYQDDLANVIVWIPGSKGCEEKEAIMLQGHMDMVGTRAADKEFDFLTQPLQLKYDGKILRADRTTLGADDGVAVSIMLALMADNEFSHPPIECVFTVQEETGLDGAEHLDISKTKSRRLINMDGNGEHTVTVGNYCSEHIEIFKDTDKFKIDYEPDAEDISKKAWQLTISGYEPFAFKTEPLLDDVHPLKNFWDVLNQYCSNFNIVYLNCGTADNVPPTVIELGLIAEEKEFLELAGELQKSLKLSFNNFKPEYYYSKELNHTVNCLVKNIPNGPLSFNEKGDMISSFMFGILNINHEELRLIGSTRCRDEKLATELKEGLARIAKNALCDLSSYVRYVSWPYTKHSPLREEFAKAVKKYWNKDIEEVICQGGLEVTDFLKKRPEFDILSVGVLCGSFHNSDEWLNVASLNRMYNLLKNMLSDEVTE